MGCPPKVQAALESVPGVEVVEIDYAQKTATVRCDSGCSEDVLVAALKEGGYGGSLR